MFGATTTLLLVLTLPVLAQIPGVPTATPPAAEEVKDPLGRDTPSGTILRFNLAARRNDLASARQFLQLTPNQRNADTLAMQLNELIDRYFAQSITSLNDTASGNAEDGLPLDRERIQLKIEGKILDIELVRINDPQAGRIWLFASDSLARVPEVHRSAEGPWFEQMMPEALVNTNLFGMSVARWLAYLGSIALPLAVMWILSLTILAIVRTSITDPDRRNSFVSWYSGVRRLSVFFVTALLHLLLLRYLSFSLRFRFVYSRFALIAAVIAAAFLLWRLLALSFAHARLLAQRRGESEISSLLMLVERVGKVVLTLIAIFAILTIAGVDTTTALAGLGIGGIALALGAQKSVENFLGSVFLITDKALAVGDQCRIADRVGTIEDITLRSVRLRTTEQTLLSIPASVLSQSSIENFSSRGKILLQSTLRLRHETTLEQLRSILDSVKQLLDEHPRVETGSSRIRLVDFGERSVELELFSYVTTPDFAKFLEIKEALLLRIAEIVKSEGAAFAQPTEFLYVDEPTEAPNVVPARRRRSGT